MEGKSADNMDVVELLLLTTELEMGTQIHARVSYLAHRIAIPYLFCYVLFFKYYSVI